MKRERQMDKEDQTIREVFHPDMLGVEVALKNAPLWKQFHGEGTEMIITKSGRRMFPSLRIGLSGLEPDQRYFVLLETSLADCHRYKFSAAEWTVVGGAEPQTHSSTRLYVHPDSPATGASWMAQDVLFHRAKLTNNTLDRSGNLVLTSMHKYQPRVHVIKASDILALHWSPTLTVTFPETEFIAVTAYQNEKITKLKIDNNPFAKGFRETGMAHTKKKSKLTTPDEDSLKKEASDDDVTEDGKSPACREESSCRERESPLPSSKAPLPPPTDDSGVSVGSASPAPLTSPSTSPMPPPMFPHHYAAAGSYPLLGDLPPPPYYPTALWPYQPFAFYHPSLAYYPPSFHLPSLPPFPSHHPSITPHHYPFDFSLKN
ncbi:hypothetical protein GE061_018199 [Apolygus lucorum]|uniref:T-box domain-containing protein n=1 Tax=Apolygus lucorum TaxID=248454 RepID=A0A8S9XD69_APOLU|nr:hypothetical protein GE061_018199 [Apolygus lucorum]